MPVLKEWKLNINVDEVLRAQGADPAVMRSRHPALAAVAERALAEGLPLIEPTLAYRRLRVKSVQHGRLLMVGGGVLSGKLILQNLAPAEEVVVMLGTIGGLLEQYAAAMLAADPVYGLALDSLGSVAIENLVVAACSYFGAGAAERNLHTTIPLNPGLEGWPVDKGQAQIFALLDPAEAGIQLTSAGMMIPQKSLSVVIGVGENVGQGGRVCDYCGMRNTCRYQDEYA